LLSPYFFIGSLTLFVLALAPLSGVLAKSQITVGEPTPLQRMRSLGDVIRDSQNRAIHIVYVHGMRAEKPGQSGAFISRLEQSYDAKETLPSSRKYLLLEPWPKGAMVGTTSIWNTEADWRAAQPFIDRYVLHARRYNATITVDEVNWWPLLFPLKCRILLEPEAMLAGVDEAHLKLCFNDTPPYHQWLTPTDYDKALATRPALGGGAKANKYVKQQIMDWGLSDAVIVTGPMRSYLNATMEAAFAYAATDKSTSEYVVISESLGSFVVLDAYSEDKPSVRAVLNATHDLYFFANQFALLELARLEHIPLHPKVVDPAQLSLTVSEPEEAQVQQSPLAALQKWASAPPPAEFTATRSSVKQIISFSDPSDALTFRVPDFANAKVSNVYVRNATPWFGLFADPVKAHSGQMQNDALWKAMVRENPPFH
jgi:hypothetical protein